MTPGYFFFVHGRRLLSIFRSDLMVPHLSLVLILNTKPASTNLHESNSGFSESGLLRGEGEHRAAWKSYHFPRQQFLLVRYFKYFHLFWVFPIRLCRKKMTMFPASWRKQNSLNFMPSNLLLTWPHTILSSFSLLTTWKVSGKVQIVPATFLGFAQLIGNPYFWVHFNAVGKACSLWSSHIGPMYCRISLGLGFTSWIHSRGRANPSSALALKQSTHLSICRCILSSPGAVTNKPASLFGGHSALSRWANGAICFPLPS